MQDIEEKQPPAKLEPRIKWDYFDFDKHLYTFSKHENKIYFYDLRWITWPGERRNLRVIVLIDQYGSLIELKTQQPLVSWKAFTGFFSEGNVLVRLVGTWWGVYLSCGMLELFWYPGISPNTGAPLTMRESERGDRCKVTVQFPSPNN